MVPTEAKVIDAEPTKPPGVPPEKLLEVAEDEVEERLEQNRLAEDAFEDNIEEAEEARRDAEADRADHGD